MRAPRPDPVSAFEATDIAADLRALVEDAQLAVSITYKSLTSQTMNVETGIATRVEAEATMSALVHEVTVYEVERSGGRLQIGDRIYQIMAADLPATPLKTTDRIVEGSVTREVVRWQRDALGSSYLVTARGGGAQ